LIRRTKLPVIPFSHKFPGSKKKKKKDKWSDQSKAYIYKSKLDYPLMRAKRMWMGSKE